MITLACTGGIGSGKSYICKIFSAMGVPVYDSDSRTKALYDEDPQLRSALVDLLGRDILMGGGGEAVAGARACDSGNAVSNASVRDSGNAVHCARACDSANAVSGARINRRAMAAKIFGNPSLMKKVKELVYPAVIKDFTKWKFQFEDSVHNTANFVTGGQSGSNSDNVATSRQSGSNSEDVVTGRQSGSNVTSAPPFVIFESAIILENPDVLVVADKVLTISSPLNVRIERVKLRDGGTDEEIKARLNNQWTDEQREARADFVIVSDNKTALLPQVENVYVKLTSPVTD
jgi:dephospho-CoA kinase